MKKFALVAALALELLEGIKEIFRTKSKVVIFPSSGSGAWEAALVNTLSPGDKVLMFETGQFAFLWQDMAGKLGLDVQFVPGDWRHGVDPDQLKTLLREDRGHQIKAVGIVHNETSTGIASRIAAARKGKPRMSMLVDAKARELRPGGWEHFTARLK